MEPVTAHDDANEGQLAVVKSYPSAENDRIDVQILIQTSGPNLEKIALESLLKIAAAVDYPDETVSIRRVLCGRVSPPDFSLSIKMLLDRKCIEISKVQGEDGGETAAVTITEDGWTALKQDYYDKQNPPDLDQPDW